MLEKTNAAVGLRTGNAATSFVLRFEQLKPLLQKEFGDTAFRSWIAPIEARAFAGGVLELIVPTRFIRDWVKTHYADRIKGLWLQSFGAIARVDVIVGTSAAKPAAAPFNHTPVANQNTSDNINVLSEAAMEAAGVSSPLDPRFTFDNFVTGKSNELAFSAAKKVATSDGASLNPLYIHGAVGLGKTHLMQAAGHALRAKAKPARVLYLSAEKFMYQFVKALRFKDTMSFKEQFRNVDVLMVDDIQFIAGKDATQEEFLHTFNALLGQGKQIIVTCDRAPSALDGVDDRLKSRLGGGLVVDVRATDEDLRLRILQAKCKMLGRDVMPEVLQFLARKIVSNVRELEGALNRLIAHADLVSRELTVETTEELLHDLLKANDRRISIEDIQKKVAEHYNIRFSDMLSPRRARPVARPRQVAMYLCKALTIHSLPEIGRKFGGRDHTTIIHGVRKIEELLKEDKYLAADIDLMKRAITG